MKIGDKVKILFPSLVGVIGTVTAVDDSVEWPISVQFTVPDGDRPVIGAFYESELEVINENA